MKSILRQNLLFTILVIWAIGPLAWQLYTSFSTADALINPFNDVMNRWTLSNYKLILSSETPFWRYLWNSFVVGIASTLFCILLSIPAAYGISKLKARTSSIIKTVLFGVALFPYVLLFLALLEIARGLNIGNNLLALSIPYTALSMPLSLLLLSAAFKDLPFDLEDAAKLEGLNFFQRLRWVLLPLIGPSTASTAILVFLFSWNEFPISLTWISDPALLTLPVAISRIAGSSVYSVPYGAYAAATVLASIPLLIIVLIFQSQIISGLTKGAVKG